MTLMTDEADLERIVADARTGADSAFSQLVERVRDRVRHWATRFSADHDEADDITQDVMIGLQRRVQQYRGDSRFSTWLYAITRHEALNRNRTDARRARIRDISVTGPTSSQQADLDEQTVAALALQYFDALPPKQRAVFERIDLKGESAADVARDLGVPASTVRAHLFKARRSIRARMLEHHEQLVREFFS